MTNKLKQLSEAFSCPRKLIISSGATTVVKKQILIVSEAAFFAERDTQGRVKEPTLHNNAFSKNLAVSVLAKYSDVVVFYYDENVRLWVVNGLDGIADANHVRYLHIDKSAVGDTINSVIKLLRSYGLKMYLPKNKRQVSWLNISRFVKDDRAVFAHATNHTALGLVMPKEKTFQALAAERSRHGWG